MQISKGCLARIKNLEGIKLRAYWSDAGVWVIGYGHTQDVKSGDKISIEEAERLFKKDIFEVEQVINIYVMVALNQYQFDALVSFVFNVGLKYFLSSTLLRKLNEGDYAIAAKEFLHYDTVNGRKGLGTLKRRYIEKKIFEGLA